MSKVLSVCIFMHFHLQFSLLSLSLLYVSISFGLSTLLSTYKEVHTDDDGRYVSTVNTEKANRSIVGKRYYCVIYRP